MSEKTPHLIKRAVQAAAFTVGGGVALTFAMAGSAHADEVTVQDANVTNTGAAAANSGGNVAVGNASDNTATSTQTANGGLLGVNSGGGASNHSDGTASITTGAATAQGSVASTGVDQAHQSGSGDGLVVTSQDADVVNAGAAAANTGGNVAVGNASTNNATSTQNATGLLASNSGGGASNHSDGTASITTGAATAQGNVSSTDVSQTSGGGTGDPFLAVLVQDSDVVNAGFGAANSGLNAAIGNLSDNTADSDQTALGLLASNQGGASNHSDGTATITTGAATAAGNTSKTTVDQVAGAGAGDDPFLAVVVQSSNVFNLGAAVANSGLNLGIGNLSDNSASTTQTATGLIASNIADGGNSSDGSATVHTGAANAGGNVSTTGIHQGADAGDGGLALVFQSAPVFNAGIGIANAGLNAGVGNDSLNSAILAQVSFGLLANNIASIDDLSDGFAMIVSGSATGIGNLATTHVDQDS